MKPVSSISASSAFNFSSASLRELANSSASRSDSFKASCVASTLSLPSFSFALRALITLTVLINAATLPPIPASRNRPSITFLKRPSISPSSPSAAKYSVTGLRRLSFINNKLDRRCSCASNTMKSAVAPAETPSKILCFLLFFLKPFSLRSSEYFKFLFPLATLSAVLAPTLELS